MVEIKFVIDDLKFDDLKAGIIKAIPKPQELQHLSDNQYLKRWLKDIVFNTYRTGKIMIAREMTPPVIEEDIVEVE